MSPKLKKIFILPYFTHAAFIIPVACSPLFVDASILYMNIPEATGLFPLFLPSQKKLLYPALPAIFPCCLTVSPDTSNIFILTSASTESLYTICVSMMNGSGKLPFRSSNRGSGVGVKVGVMVGVSVSVDVCVTVNVTVNVGVSVCVGVTVKVGVTVGVSVNVDVSVMVGVTEEVCVMVGVSVNVWVWVMVGEFVKVWEMVGVSVIELVCVMV